MSTCGECKHYQPHGSLCGYCEVDDFVTNSASGICSAFVQRCPLPRIGSKDWGWADCNDEEGFVVALTIDGKKRYAVKSTGWLVSVFERGKHTWLPFAEMRVLSLGDGPLCMYAPETIRFSQDMCERYERREWHRAQRASKATGGEK